MVWSTGRHSTSPCLLTAYPWYSLHPPSYSALSKPHLCKKASPLNLVFGYFRNPTWQDSSSSLTVLHMKLGEAHLTSPSFLIPETDKNVLLLKSFRAARHNFAINWLEFTAYLFVWLVLEGLKKKWLKLNFHHLFFSLYFCLRDKPYKDGKSKVALTWNCEEIP